MGPPNLTDTPCTLLCPQRRQRAKIISYDGAMLLMPSHKDVEVTLVKEDWSVDL
jgi:hypothetical protein